MKQLHGDLVSLGYEGSYNRVAAFARDWKADLQRELQTTGRGTFVPLAFDPGEAFQFDWSEHRRSSAMNAPSCRWPILSSVTPGLSLSGPICCRTHEMLFDAHNHAFRVFSGVPRRGIYDNMKTAIDKVGRGKSRRTFRMFVIDCGSHCIA